jgi:hypothetical protein
LAVLVAPVPLDALFIGVVKTTFTDDWVAEALRKAAVPPVEPVPE